MTLALVLEKNGQLLSGHDSPLVEVPAAMQWYLTNFPRNKAFKFLARLDPYDDTQIPPVLLNDLREGVVQLVAIVRSKQGPVPPEFVESLEPDEPQGKPFGWDGLSEWVESARCLIAEAESSGANIVAAGD